MRIGAVALLALSLLGCDAEYQEADGMVLCAMDGRAFHVTKHFGNTSVVKAAPSADRLCAKLIDAESTPPQ